MADLANENLYEILGVEETADKKQIVRAYRKRALKCHPDKNPDNPKAAEEFHLLSKALEILTDAAARTAYDKLRQAKKAAEARTRALDSKRRKLKDDLEAREQAAQSTAAERKTQYDSRTAEEKLRAEIERLRNEGSSILRQEREAMKKQMRDEVQGAGTLRLRLRWKGKATKQYTEEDIEEVFSKHGAVITVLLSKKSGSALLELKPTSRVKSYLHEIGSVENPLKVILVGEDGASPTTTAPRTEVPANMPEPAASFAADFETSVLSKMIAAQRAKEAQSARKDKPAAEDSVEDSESFVGTNSLNSSEPPKLDPTPLPTQYESVHAFNARRQAERQRLIEQMMKDDEDSRY